jgi:tetratricopeptide (TPR) repeat protein
MSHRHVVWGAVLATSTTFAAATAAHAQRFETTDLLARGSAAYDRLPERVTLRDARLFSEALVNLYAYEQRSIRERAAIAPQTQRAIDWLIGSIALMQTAKADDGNRRGDDELLDRGLQMASKAKASLANGVVWDVTSYLSGAANLFAYLQCAPNPSGRARTDYGWLVKAQNQLVVAGDKGDDPNAGRYPPTWMPRRPRPGARGTGAIAGSTVAVGASPSPVAGNAGDRGAPDADPSDAGALQRLQQRNEQLRVELAAANAANDSLRRANDELRRTMGAVRTEDAPVTRRDMVAARLIAQGRLREARDLARSRLEANPADGDAHLVLSQVYAKASGPAATPEERAVLWLAIHHLTIAMKSGAIGYDVGRKILEDYVSRTPTAEDFKARGWVDGQRLRVSFAPYEWIDEETTIRPRKE